MSSHPLYWLLFMTLFIVLAFAGWSYVSTKRRQETGGRTSGLGGPNDPLS